MKRKPTFKSPDEVEAVFYEAFMHCDKAVMAALWAEGDVVCVHPGSAAIVGHEAVVRSWAHILTDATRPDIHYTVSKRSDSSDLAVHLVTENITTAGEAALVFCTNVYQKFDSGWLMIEHHATLTPFSPHGRTIQ
jgi:hypothetical protein